MAKLTKKTAKEGQKCVLTLKTPLFHDYKEICIPWLNNDTRDRRRDNSPETIAKFMATPNIAYVNYREDYYRANEIPTGLDPKRIKPGYEGSIEYCTDEVISIIVSEEYKSKLGSTVYSHIGNVILDSMKIDAKLSKYVGGIGEMTPAITLEKGTEVELTNIFGWGGGKGTHIYKNIGYDQVLLTVLSGPHAGTYFTSEMGSVQSRLDTAHFEDMSAEYNEAPKYKIFYDGKPYKTKIFDSIAKIKASLMDAYGYNDKVSRLNRHYQELSPEVGGSTPEWLTGGEQLNRKDAKKIEVYEWVNRKKGKLIEFDAVKYYDSLFDFAKVTAQYGSAVRELYKTHKETGEFSTIVCFMHEEYRNTNKNYWSYYEDLKESDIIKAAMKLANVKGTKKCTKNGKTAFVFKSESDAMKLLRHLEKGTYFVLDMNGQELIEQSEQFVKNVARMKKLERIVIEEFADDVE